MIKQLLKLITILGPTASGKSSLGIELAQELNGEIISADSRQVFRRLDIGSGKVTKEEQAQVPHHLLDIANPMDEFSVAHFQKLAFSTIGDILSRGKLPFLVGGTALYIYSVIDNYKFSNVLPNLKLREKLEGKSAEELLVILKTRHPDRSVLAKQRDLILDAQAQLNETPPLGACPEYARGSRDDGVIHGLSPSDRNNPRRLIRAIEKLKAGEPIKPQKGKQKYENIILGIDFPREELYKRIDSRVDQRLNKGMIEEVEHLRENGVKDEWLIRLGLEYRWITEYLQKKHSKDEMIKRLKGAIHAFARRQMTWFNRDKRIHWIKNKTGAEKILQKEKGLA